MPTERICANCGAPLPANAPQTTRGCPTCLLQMGLDEAQVAESSMEVGVSAEEDRGVVAETGLLPEAIGATIGRYKLLQQIGEGGFGVVFMAEQTEPVQRKVALKIIKAGMDTREVIARFEAERQALALMDHPNIAKVLDAGTTGSPLPSDGRGVRGEGLSAGRPYFVMELVRGIPITNYCDQANLSTRQRLELFIRVCRAVQHAHQKGVIHRDLKPSNVLVTLHDGEPVPKVIDFGVAKALGQKLTEKTLFTRFEQMLGTPAYMSPEQAALSGLDIDTRSDIYSLGVLLYELLTGVTPLDEETLRQGALDEVRRVIRETDPPKPSTRLLTLGNRLAEVAKHRQAEPATLNRLLRGDLDWITMKALEKDRQRRYETVNGLARDIERHLHHEPVVARPPSTLYRFQKAARRHRVAFTAGAAVAVALVLGVVDSTWQAVRATRAEGEQKRQRERADDEAAHAKRAELETREQLRQSYLDQARANRWSGRAGRRFDSLEVLKKAAEIRPAAELRNEAIACMAMTDLRLASEWQSGEPAEARIVFSPRLESYVVFNHPQRPVTLFRLEDHAELMRAPDEVPRLQNAITFSSDSRYVAMASAASGASPAVLRVWDIERNAIIFRHPHPYYGVQDFHLSDYGNRLAVVYWRWGPGRSVAPVYVFDLKSGNLLLSLDEEVKSQDERAVARLSGDGRELAVCQFASTNVQVINVDSHQTVLSLLHPKPVMALGWHPDGSLLATACIDAHVYVWDAVTGTLRNELRGHQSEAVYLAFNHRGDLLATGGWDGTLRLWDPLGGALPVTIGTDGPLIAFSEDDRRLLAGVLMKRFLFHEIADASECRVLHSDVEPYKGPRGCRFSPDGLWLASAHSDGVRIWEVATGREVGMLSVGYTWSALFHPNGQRLFTSGSAGLIQWPFDWQQEGRNYNVRIGPPKPFRASDDCNRANLDGEGRLLGFTEGDRVRVVDVESGDDRIPAIEAPVAHVALSRDAKYCAVGELGSRQNVRVRNLQTGELIRELADTDDCNAVSFSPDGKWLATSRGRGRDCRFWAVGTWQCVHVVQQTGSGVAVPISFSLDGSMAAVRLGSGRVRLLAPGSWRELADLEPPSAQFLSDLAFSPDGRYLAAAAETKVIQLWDLRSIRQQLAAMKLDWEAPPLPAPATNQFPGKVVVTILGGTNASNAPQRNSP